MESIPVQKAFEEPRTNLHLMFLSKRYIFLVRLYLSERFLKLTPLLFAFSFIMAYFSLIFCGINREKLCVFKNVQNPRSTRRNVPKISMVT